LEKDQSSILINSSHEKNPPSHETGQLDTAFCLVKFDNFKCVQITVVMTWRNFYDIIARKGWTS
jgi:hypothetical protein